MRKISILLISLLAFSATAFIACSDDDLGPSIFDTQEKPLDRTVFTFPLDTFVKANFLEPYNLKFIYKLPDISSDLQKNLIPASYENSVKLAVLCKYLWYDVYLKHAGIDFLKSYSPRILLLTGSPSVNASSHTETLGTAEGGLKIYLYKVNTLNENDVDHLNYYFFHTMHHEFAHILDQTHSRPQAFNLLSNGKYDPQSWGEQHDSVSVGKGFITPYASSAAREDWVEVMSSYITNDEKELDDRIISGIAGKPDFTVISIYKNMMNKEIGFVRRALAVIEEAGVSFDHIPTGIDSLSMFIATSELEDKLEDIIEALNMQLRPDEISVENRIGLIAVVGRKMRRSVGAAAKICSVLAQNGINIRMLNQGTNEINVIVGVDADDFARATQVIYEGFVG